MPKSLRLYGISVIVGVESDFGVSVFRGVRIRLYGSKLLDWCDAELFRRVKDGRGSFSWIVIVPIVRSLCCRRSGYCLACV